MKHSLPHRLSIFFLTVLLSFGFSLKSGAQNKTVSFEVDGLKVILKQTQKETIVMSMYFKGGLTNYPAKEAGIESLALSGILKCGTANFNADSFNDQCDEYGLHLDADAKNDYGVVTLGCISRYAEQGWKMFSSAIAAPVFEQQKFSLLKDQKIEELKRETSNPDVRLRRLAEESAFSKTVYASNPSGTLETLRQLSAEAVKNYYNKTLLNKKRMFLVVAGNISKEDLEGKIRSSFSEITSATYQVAAFKTPLFSEDTYQIEDRSIATNYICGIINAPALSHPDYPAYRLAVTILHSALFNEIRLSKHLSYAPSARIYMGNIPYTMMYASTTQPKETISTMKSSLNFIQQRLYSDALIQDICKGFMSSYLQKQEHMAAIVESLGEAELMGDWHLADDMVNRVQQVTPQNVKDALNYYTKHISWAYLGSSKLGEQAFSSLGE